jgi:hypothetical protein
MCGGVINLKIAFEQARNPPAEASFQRHAGA